MLPSSVHCTELGRLEQVLAMVFPVVSISGGTSRLILGFIHERQSLEYCSEGSGRTGDRPVCESCAATEGLGVFGGLVKSDKRMPTYAIDFPKKGNVPFTFRSALSRQLEGLEREREGEGMRGCSSEAGL